MKNTVTITKSIAVLLCIITMVISFNIYLSYKDIYVSNNSPRDSIIYIAVAKSPLNDSNLSINDPNAPSIESDEINKSKPTSNSSEEDVQKKIFINMLILFLSFISLASVHNLILGIETSMNCNPRTILNGTINKKTNINSTSSVISKEGAK